MSFKFILFLREGLTMQLRLSLNLLFSHTGFELMTLPLQSPRRFWEPCVPPCLDLSAVLKQHGSWWWSIPPR